MTFYIKKKHPKVFFSPPQPFQTICKNIFPLKEKVLVYFSIPAGREVPDCCGLCSLTSSQYLLLFPAEARYFQCLSTESSLPTHSITNSLTLQARLQHVSRIFWH